jgi:hypothetical protein
MPLFFPTRISNIDNLEAAAKVPPVRDDRELQAQISRFLCVLSSGLIEQSLIIILENYSAARSHPRVSQYTNSQLARIQNAKFEDILSTLGRFDSAWRQYFEDTTAGEVKAAIDSLVNNRNQISHGGQVNISLAIFSEYYRLLKKFILDLDTYIATS